MSFRDGIEITYGHIGSYWNQFPQRLRRSPSDGSSRNRINENYA